MTNGGGQLKISGYSSSSSSWLGTALYDDSGSPLCSCCPDHWKPRNKNTIKARKAANNLYDARIPMAPINNPPSIVPPPVPTPTNRPFRIPVRKKWGKVTVIFDQKKRSYLAVCFNFCFDFLKALISVQITSGRLSSHKFAARWSHARRCKVDDRSGTVLAKKGLKSELLDTGSEWEIQIDVSWILCYTSSYWRWSAIGCLCHRQGLNNGIKIA